MDYNTGMLPNKKLAQRHFSVLFWNAGGMSQSKKIMIQKILCKQDIDLFIVAESNIDREREKFYKFKNYNVNILQKHRQIASGLLVGIKQNLNGKFEIVKEMNTNDYSEIIKATVWKCNNKFKVYGIYSPPNNNNLNLDLLENDKKTIIIGDLNGHSPRWGYSNVNKVGKIIEDYLDANTMNILYNNEDPNTFIHYNGQSTNPDIAIVSTDIENNTTKSVIEDSGSGHRAIITKTSFKHQSGKENKKLKRKWNFKKADRRKYKTETNQRFKNINLEENTNKIVKQLNEVIIQAAKLSVPRGKTRKYKPFWNAQLAQLKLKRDKIREKAERTANKLDVIEWRKASAQLKQEIKIAKKKSFEKFLTQLDYRSNSSHVHKYIKQINNNNVNQQQQQPLIVNNKEIYDDSIIADKFVTHYKNASVLHKENKKLNKHLKIKNQKNTTSTQNMFNEPFTLAEMKQALRILKNGKSPGPDNIHTEFLKNLGNSAQQTLLTIFNKIWTTKNGIPTIWKKAIIIPVKKKDKPAQLIESYRPISLTSITAKLLERMIAARLTYYLESQNLISNEQTGFRKDSSPIHQLTRFTQEVKTNFNKNETTLALFVDFKGAFDNVWREKLVYKMKHMGIKGHMLNWFQDFLSQRWIAVRYKEALSKWTQTRIGLPQGAVTSALLFNIYINDLTETLKKTNNIQVGMFADDVVIWTSTKNRQNKTHYQELVETMKNAITNLEKWSNENNMSINTSKTQFQIFTTQHKTKEIQLTINNNQIQEAKTTTYLGIELDKKTHNENPCEQHAS